MSTVTAFTNFLNFHWREINWEYSFNPLLSTSFSMLGEVSSGSLRFLTSQYYSYSTLQALRLLHYSNVFVKNLRFYNLLRRLGLDVSLLHITRNRLQLSEPIFPSLTIHCERAAVTPHLPRHLFLVQSMLIYLNNPSHLLHQIHFVF